jgi:serine protease Do
MHEGDFVTKFDGKSVSDSRALSRIVADTAINKTVPVELIRKGKKMNLRVTVLRLNEKQAPPPKQAPAALEPKVTMLGLSLGMLDANGRNEFRIANNVQGVLVVDVAAESPAAEKNIRAGDVIVQVQGVPVKTPQEVTNRIAADRKAGKKVELLLVNRGGELTYFAVKLN